VQSLRYDCDTTSCNKLTRQFLQLSIQFVADHCPLSTGVVVFLQVKQIIKRFSVYYWFACENARYSATQIRMNSLLMSMDRNPLKAFEIRQEVSLSALGSNLPWSVATWYKHFMHWYATTVTAAINAVTQYTIGSLMYGNLKSSWSHPYNCRLKAYIVLIFWAEKSIFPE